MSHTIDLCNLMMRGLYIRDQRVRGFIVKFGKIHGIYERFARDRACVRQMCCHDRIMRSVAYGALSIPVT